MMYSLIGSEVQNRYFVVAMWSKINRRLQTISWGRGHLPCFMNYIQWRACIVEKIVILARGANSIIAARQGIIKLVTCSMLMKTVLSPFSTPVFRRRWRKITTKRLSF